jgi:uncharacterized protein YoxC
MTLIVMTIIVIGLMIAALAIYLFMIGELLNRTAGNLGDCLQSLRTVAGQTNAIRPGVQRINKTGGELLGALPLLLEDVDSVSAKLAPSANTSEAAPAAAAVSSTAASTTPTITPTATSVGYLDKMSDPDSTPVKGVGYMDS